MASLEHSAGGGFGHTSLFPGPAVAGHVVQDAPPLPVPPAGVHVHRFLDGGEGLAEAAGAEMARGGSPVVADGDFVPGLDEPPAELDLALRRPTPLGQGQPEPVARGLMFGREAHGVLEMVNRHRDLTPAAADEPEPVVREERAGIVPDRFFVAVDGPLFIARLLGEAPEGEVLSRWPGLSPRILR